MRPYSIGSCLLSITLLLLSLWVALSVSAQSGDSLDWSVQQLSDGQADAGVPVIVADHAGGVHVFWPQRAAGDADKALYYAQNDGTGWSINDVIVGDIGEVAVAMDSYDILHLVWTEGRSVRYSYASTALAPSARGWAQPTIIGDGPAYTPDLLFDPSGILHLAYSYIADISAVCYVRSTDGGQSWSRPMLFETPRSDAATDRPQMALGEDGTLHMVWGLVPTSNYYGGLGVYYARSTDAGQSWSDPVRIDEDSLRVLGKGAWLASVAVIGSTEVHVVWDAHTEAGKRYHQWSRDGGVTWSGAEPVWHSFISQTGPNPMMVDSAGTLYLFSLGAPDWGQRQGLYFSRWNGANWEDLQLANLSSDGPHFVRVAVTQGNKLHVAWQARAAEPQEIWYASAGTAAPYMPPGAFPTSVPTPTVRSTPTLAPSPTVTPQRVMDASGLTDNTTTNPSYAIITGVLPVSLTLAIVIAIRTTRARGR